MKDEKKILNSPKLFFMEEKLKYLTGKEFLREKKYKKSIKYFFKIKDFRLKMRLLVQLVSPNFFLNFLKNFKFK